MGAYTHHPRLFRAVRRLVGLVATAALLGAAVVIGLMIEHAVRGDDGGDESPVTAPSTGTTGGSPAGGLSPHAVANRRVAVKAVKRRGFTPASVATWRPHRKLQVLVGRPTGDAKGGRRAFFFVGRKYVGTDTADNSARVRVVSGRGRRVTLRYRLYGPADQPCCPKGETTDVRFEWTGKELKLLDAMPTAELRTVRR